MSTRSDTRLWIFAVLVTALLVTLVARTVQLTVLRGGEYARAADANDSRIVTVAAPRGVIVDREGEPLAGSDNSLLIRVDPARLPEDENLSAEVLADVAELLGISGSKLRARMIPCGSEGAEPPPDCNEGSPTEPVVVGAGVDPGVTQPVIETPERFPGVDVVATPQRSYPGGDLRASHVLGYLGRVTADEMAANDDLLGTDLVGRSGLEMQYDAELSGVSGRRLLTDSRGASNAAVADTPPVPGSTLVTSLDADLQRDTERALARRLDGSKRSGSAVVLDVETGRVLALASYPDYDPSIWTGGISTKDYNRLVRTGALVNSALLGSYPPGSIFKPIVVSAMERTGYDLRADYECPGSYQAGGQEFDNYAGIGYGTISLARALEVSCNSVFYRVADELWSKGGGERSDAEEIDPIARAAIDLGLGAGTGVDLPGETPGRVSSPASKYQLWAESRELWCAARRPDTKGMRKKQRAEALYAWRLDKENCVSGNVWRRGDAVMAGIGQGITAASAIQMAAAYAAIADDGRLRSPRVARALIAADGTVTEIDPPVISRDTISKRARRYLADALPGVTTSGTARVAFDGFPLDRYPVAGKTGTAETSGSDASWFASFSPARNPKYAVVTNITGDGEDVDPASYIAREIYDSIYGVGREPTLPASGPVYPIPEIRAVTAQ